MPIKLLEKVNKYSEVGWDLYSGSIFILLTIHLFG